MRHLALTAAGIAAALCAAITGLSAVAQEADGWSIPLNWTDGRMVQWRTTSAPACDGSNVDLLVTNNSTAAGVIQATGITFSCVRGGEFVAPDRLVGLVQAGGAATVSDLSCMCADRGGVASLLKMDMPFVREGAGRESTTDGCTYEGDFSAGLRSGRGVYSCPTGYRYEGDWINGKQQGEGAETLPGGHSYTGEFSNGRPGGEGRMTYGDGSIHEGSFRDGQREGYGTMKFADGSEYIGEWKADKRDGLGALIASDKSWTYDGEWVNDQRDGNGKLTYNDGSYAYSGTFVDGKRVGEGEVSFGDGRIFRGAYVDDQQVGKGVLAFPDGRKISGEFRDHRPHGHALDEGPNGRFEGNWAEGRLDGRAIVIGADGLRFEGIFTGGLRNGVGRQWRADGSSDECMWVNDVATKPCKRIRKGAPPIEFR